MSGIVGSYFNTRGSGVVAKLGTDGQLFTSSGAGVSNTFEDAAGGGMHTLVSTHDITTDTDPFDGDQLLTTAYNNWVIDFFNICPTDVDNQDMIMYMRSGGAGSESTFTGNVQYGRHRNHGSGGLDNDRQTATGGHMRFHHSGVRGGDDNYGGYYRMQLFNVHNKAPSTTTSVGFMFFKVSPLGRTAASHFMYGGHTWGHIETETDYTGFHLTFGSAIRGANRPRINCYGVNNVN